MADDTLSKLTAAQDAVDKAILVSQKGAQPWSPEIVQSLTLTIMGFTLITLVLASILLWKQGSNPQQILKIFGLLTIVGLSAVLLVAGYSNDQLTPIVGLFGAIAGYLLGKDGQADKT